MPNKDLCSSRPTSLSSHLPHASIYPQHLIRPQNPASHEISYLAIHLFIPLTLTHPVLLFHSLNSKTRKVARPIHSFIHSFILDPKLPIAEKKQTLHELSIHLHLHLSISISFLFPFFPFHLSLRTLTANSSSQEYSKDVTNAEWR